MKLSVIVCTQNRAYAIVPCLDSIAQSLAHAAPVDAEIVVVDNDSGDNTSALVHAWAASCAFPVNLQFEPKKGLARARNRAIRAAKGDLLIWTDDDCRLDKDYIRETLRHNDADTKLVLRGGRIELGDPADLPLTIKTERSPKHWNRQMHSAKYEHLGGSVSGCNMTMRRALIDRLGFFDERFGPGTNLPGADDTDYIYRTYLAGLTIEYVPDMVVFHHHGRKSISDGKKLLQNYMIGTGGLYVKYFFKDPNLCRQFSWDIKNSIREAISGQNTCLPSMNFSHKDKVIYCTLGVIRYFIALIRRSK